MVVTYAIRDVPMDSDAVLGTTLSSEVIQNVCYRVRDRINKHNAEIHIAKEENISKRQS